MESRNLRVTGKVDVTGGNVTIGATLRYTFTPDGNQPPATIEETAFPSHTIAPNTGGMAFDVFSPIVVPPGTSTEGTLDVFVTGTDERGGTVNVTEGPTPTRNGRLERAFRTPPRCA